MSRCVTVSIEIDSDNLKEVLARFREIAESGKLLEDGNYDMIVSEYNGVRLLRRIRDITESPVGSQ